MSSTTQASIDESPFKNSTAENSVTATTVTSNPQRTNNPEISPRTVTLTEAQTLSYWRHVQHLIRQDSFDYAIPVLKLLSSANGVPAEIKISADKLLLRIPNSNRRISQRTVTLTEAQTLSYWRYVQHLIRQDSIDYAIPVLKLLSSANGVPAKIKISADKLLLRLPNSNRRDSATKQITPTSTLSLWTEISASYSDDNRLGGYIDDQPTVLGTDIGLSYYYQFNSTISSYFDMGVWVDSDTGDTNTLLNDPEFYRGSTWINLDFSDKSINRDLTIGTQSISDSRGWWWDDERDLAALYLSNDNWSFTGALGVESTEQLFGNTISPYQDKVVHLLGEYEWQWREEHSLSLAFLAKHDNSAQQTVGDIVPTSEADYIDSRVNWLGFKSTGTLYPEQKPVQYRLDFAMVNGHEFAYDYEQADNNTLTTTSVGTIKVRGWGLDLGASIATGFYANPEFSIGFATTSADNNTDDLVDNTFRQTGLHSGNYGSLLDPELSNLSIISLGVELSLPYNSSFTTTYNDFRQVSATDYLRNADIYIDWSGENPRIGRELELLLEIPDWNSFYVSLSFSVFKAGEAAMDLAGKTSKYGSIDLYYDLY